MPACLLHTKSTLITPTDASLTNQSSTGAGALQSIQLQESNMSVYLEFIFRSTQDLQWPPMDLLPASTMAGLLLEQTESTFSTLLVVHSSFSYVKVLMMLTRA